MFKRVLSMVILAAMLTAMAACSSDAQDGEETTEPTAEENQPEFPAGIEPKAYGLTFNVLYPQWQLYTDHFFNEEISSDRLPQALYNREVKVEDYLGVTITNTPVPGIGDIQPAMQQNVMAGDDEYQMVFTHCYTSAKALLTEGYLLDVNEIPTLDLSNPYWNQDSNENLEVDGKQYFFTGDYNIPTPGVVLFNKEMLEQLGLEDPYQLVRDGDWTIDKMMEMMSAATKDDGDTKWTLNDTYGFGCPDGWFLTNFMYGAGVKIMGRDENNEFMLTMDSERVYNMVEKVTELLTSKDTYLYNYRTDYEADITKSLNISTGRCLFSLCCTSNLDFHRESEVEYGILPYPKLDEKQDRYYALDWAGLLCVPSTVNDVDMVGEVIELLGYYSGEEVIPTYYDIVLGTKLSRDDDSREMLELVFDNVIFDAGMCYFGSDDFVKEFFRLPTKLPYTNWSGYASFYAKYELGAKNMIQKFNEAVKYLD